MRVPFTRIVAVVLSGLAVIGVLAVFLVVANAGAGFTLSSVAGAFGWILPIVAGVAVGGLAWSLHRGGRLRARSKPTLATARCDSCGSAMMESWRLCPYCGDLIENLPPEGECVTRAL